MSGLVVRKTTFYKQQLCFKWQQKLCTAGQTCTFAHGEAELRLTTRVVPPPVFVHGEGHGEAELRQTPRVVPPPVFLHGEVHGEAELRQTARVVPLPVKVPDPNFFEQHPCAVCHSLCAMGDFSHTQQKSIQHARAHPEDYPGCVKCRKCVAEAKLRVRKRCSFCCIPMDSTNSAKSQLKSPASQRHCTACNSSVRRGESISVNAPRFSIFGLQ